MANTKKYVSLDKLGLYDEKIKGVISAGDTATLTAAEVAAKAYADGLASNYDAAGAAATAESNANTYTDGKITEVNGVVAGVKTTAEKGVADAATADGKAVAAQAAADAAQADVDALAEYVGTIPEGYTEANVVAYIDKKAAETLAAASGNSTETAASVKAQLDEYKTANDKAVADVKVIAEQGVADAATAQAAADAAQADIDTFVDETYATDKAALIAEDARIAGLVATEQARAEGVESGLDERLVEVEAFFKLAEGEQLDTALDTLKEIQTYITTEGSAADQMVLDIAANAKAIEDEAKARAEADEAIDGRLDVLEAINHEAYVAADTTLKNELTGEINKKADQTALESAVQTLEGADTAIKGRLDNLEAKFNGEEGSVSDMIADAKQEAIDAAAGDATSKANAAETAAKGHADSLNTAMNTRVEALEAIDHEHSNKALLDTYTQTEANLADAVAKKHSHTNLEVLEGITSAKVTAWDAAEGNAKTYADGLNTAMNTRVEALETWHNNFSECSEDDIKALFGETTV